MSGLDDCLHGFGKCRESTANEAQRQLRGKHFNTVIDKYCAKRLIQFPTPDAHHGRFRVDVGRCTSDLVRNCRLADGRKQPGPKLHVFRRTLPLVGLYAGHSAVIAMWWAARLRTLPE